MGTFSADQIMMTLAQLAATAPDERPSGESLAQHETRIFDAINAQLTNTDLATGGEWQAVWVGLTADRANLAYIAQNSSGNAFAVCLRGTQFTSLTDLAEDLNVGTVAQFTAGPPCSEPILISTGAMEAFTEVTSAVYVQDNTNLLQALTALFESVASQPTLYITGHSLGGAMATVIALYLYAQMQSWSNQPKFEVYTFAAPTAGLAAFADCYDATFSKNSWRYYNVWDLVPNAWATLNTVRTTFYPSQVSSTPGPGPAQSLTANGMIGQFAKAPGSNVYVQTNQSNTAVPINPTYGTESANSYDPACVNPTMGDFMGQVGYQHNNYLVFLEAPPIPSLTPTVANNTGTPTVPIIAPITPNNGSSAGGTVVTINGANFTSDCMVDFGTIPATSVSYVSATQLTAVSPPGVGTVDVRVTNNFGTSAATPADQFTTPPPPSTQSPTVTSISPSSGPSEAGYAVTITGTGFTSDCSVFFGATQIAADQVMILSLTEIVVVSPFAGTGTVAVTVTTTGSAGSATSPTFTIGPPVVTGVSPSFGLLGSKANNPAVTISGAGFGTTQGTVQFVNSAGTSTPAASISNWSDTQITATPPNIAGTGNSSPMSVTVTNSTGQASGAVSTDQYVYYNKAELTS